MNRVRILGLEAMKTVMEGMDQHKYDADVQLYACWALVELSSGGEDEDEGSGGGGEGEQPGSTPGGRPESAASSPQRRSSASATSPRRRLSKRSRRPRKRDIVDAVLDAMRRHVLTVDVQRYGCKALENLGSRSGSS